MIIDRANEQILVEEERHKRDPKVYWPSQASIVLPTGEVIGECARKSFYRINMVAETNPAAIRHRRARLYGKKIEEAEIQLLKDRKVLLGEQVLLKKQYNDLIIRGKVDVVAQDDIIRGGEYKTGGGYYFQNEVFGTASRDGKPRIDNLMQVMIYLDSNTETPELAFKEVSLIYIDRGICDSKEFIITLDSGFPVIDDDIDYSLNINDIYKRFTRLDNYVTKNELPPCDYANYYSMSEVTDMFYQNKITKSKFNTWKKIGHGMDHRCGYCNWLDKCRKDSLTG